MQAQWRDPYVIMVAPNGARRTKDDHSALPMGEAEIVEAVYRAHQAGAQAAHVHVRDESGGHVLDIERYLSLTQALRNRCGDDLIVQITTEAVGRYSPAEQRAVVDAVKPQAVSIALKELFADPAEHAINRDFLKRTDEQGTAVQWILYDPTELDQFAQFLADGIVQKPSPMLFVLGRYTKGQESKPADIIDFLSSRSTHSSLQNTSWSVCAFGTGETACLSAALCLGGDVRIGFENSLWNADGTLASSNDERVAAIKTVAEGLALNTATPSQVRAKLGVRHT